MLHQGKLRDWNPSDGSGFIQQEKAGPDIRISSSGFRKKPENLQDGDSIFFQIEVDPQGKPKAVFAYRAGQHFAPAPAVKKPALSSLPFQQLLSVVVTLSILAWFGYQSMHLLRAEVSSPAVAGGIETADPQSTTASLENPVWPPIQAQQDPQFQCEGKQHCSEMSSCEEAEFYLEQCPNVLIDGDRDGIPCERTHCSHRLF
ncbi:MAG TPA: excalibur calcium-binding domain-containing protein [Rheinheimera sp.]|uniref:excalibur calcium-binding domain-containing protein n=1 Tax=Rheinheimera sp. TaxID=1869214 RepID=UPI002B45A837|nr:excalibur calcium-binding domain-containing protein [Rheinheimera sp.]HJS14930.1 excalibur calcium-binding domain-containing protein [Rheinheimera sp.]